MTDRFGHDQSLFFMADIDEVVPPDHPLREAKVQADQLLSEVSGELNEELGQVDCSAIKLRFLMALIAFPSESQAWDAIEYHLVYRWFVDSDPMEEPLPSRQDFESAWMAYEKERLVRGFFAGVLRSTWLGSIEDDDRVQIDYPQLRSLAEFRTGGSGRPREVGERD